MNARFARLLAADVTEMISALRHVSRTIIDITPIHVHGGAHALAAIAALKSTEHVADLLRHALNAAKEAEAGEVSP